MGSIKFADSKETEERINSLKDEIKNKEIENTETKSSKKPVASKLNKKFIKIVMANEKLSEEEVYSKFANNNELHKYIKEKDYKEKRKPRKNPAQLDDTVVTKIVNIVNNETSDTEKINKIKEVIEEQNKFIKLKKQLSQKEKEHETYISKKKNIEDKLSKLNKEIEDLKKQIKGN